jgi:hypothetical protein
MIEDHALLRLADADPAGELDPAPSEDVLAHLLAQPSGPERTAPALGVHRLWLYPRIALVAVAVIAVIAVVALVADLSGSPRTLTPGAYDLAAKAYAQTSAQPGEIVHTVATTERTETTAAGETRETGSIEEWHRGQETHRIERYGTGGSQVALDHVIDADGVMRQVNADGGYRIVRKSDNEDAANVIAQQQAGFVEEFRQRYERGELDPAGDVQFAGRPARRYLVSGKDNAAPGPPGGPRLLGPEQAYYIDRETAEPLGYTSTMKLNQSDGISRPGPRPPLRAPRAGQRPPTPTIMRFVETVRTIERLEPTPENLRRLRTLSLPRRRDADGCIRGPVVSARSSDTASKRDCGGTPGAVIGG